MKLILSQLAQLIGTAAETVAEHARALAGHPSEPKQVSGSEQASSPREGAFVHLVACDSCRAQYDVTAYVSSSLRCRCGHLVQVRAHAVVHQPIQRCGACGGPMEDGATGCGFCGGQVEQDARALTLLCPECFAANPRRGQFCRGCGVALAPETVGEAKPTGHDCPVCAVPLFQRRLNNAWVEECSGCHGLFVAAAHFEHLVQHSARVVKPAAAPAVRTAPVALVPEVVIYRRCPECDQLMQRRNYGRVSGVIVDECKPHGTWLDANELEVIGRFISSGQQARARQHEAEQARHEAERTRHRASVDQARSTLLPKGKSFMDVLGGDD